MRAWPTNSLKGVCSILALPPLLSAASARGRTQAEHRSWRRSTLFTPVKLFCSGPTPHLPTRQVSLVVYP